MKKAINKDILKIALPSILANITVPLVGMVDIAVAGHLSSGSIPAASYIGGIAVGTLLFDLMYMCFGFLRAGTGGITAQAYGAGDSRECALTLSRSLVIAEVSALFLILIQWPFLKVAMLFVDCSSEVASLASQYFFIRIWAAPATLGQHSVKGWLIGMQDGVGAMAVDLTVNVGNIILSVILARFFGFAGIALGTVCAQWTGFAVGLAIVRIKYRKVYSFRSLRGCFKEKATLRRFFGANANLLVRSCLIVVIYCGFTSISSGYNDLLLASGAIIMKLMLLFSYFVDGFAFAAEALSGRFIGERNHDMFRRTVNAVFLWAGAIAVFFALLYAFFGDAAVGILTSDALVKECCFDYIIWMILMPVLGCIAFVWDGVYIGSLQTESTLWAMFFSALAFFGGYFLMNTFWGDGAEGSMHLLLAAYFAHLMVRSAHLSAVYPRLVRKKFCINSTQS